MHSFDQMVSQLSRATFKDTESEKVYQRDFELFLKEYIFEKLKGIKLGEAFSKKFHINDRVLYMFSNEEDTIKHIENWYITK